MTCFQGLSRPGKLKKKSKDFQRPVGTLYYYAMIMSFVLFVPV